MTETNITPAQKIQKFLDRDDLREKFQEILGKRSSAFLTSVMSVVTGNTKLLEADIKTIYSAAVTAATLNLPINPNLGLAYIVPYKGKAQFQMGYKGFIQLAQRSKQFKTISATPVYEGQLVGENPLEGYQFDRTVEKKGQPIGYASYFKLLNGFEKVLYMSKKELKDHGLKFSASYKYDERQGKSSSLRSTDFDSMAIKTVIKLLLSKRAPLSVEMETAITYDQSVVEDDEIEYPDNDQDEIISMDLDDKLSEISLPNKSEKTND